MIGARNRGLTAFMRGYWSLDSRSWDDRLGDAGYRAHVAEVADWLESAMPAPADVIDLGCGTGNYALELGRRGHRVVGVDFARGPLQRAEAKRTAEQLDTVRFEAADLTEPLAYGDASFDAALAIYSTPMLEPAPLFAEVARILRPAGVLVVETPSPSGRITHTELDAPPLHRAFFRVKEALISLDRRVGLIKLRSAEEMRDVFARAGLEVIDDNSTERSLVLVARRRMTP